VTFRGTTPIGYGR